MRAIDKVPTQKKNKKKKKKKKSKLKPEEILEQVTTKETTGVESNHIQSETPSNVSDSLALFWRSFLLPCIRFIVSLITWLIAWLMKSTLGGKGGKKKRR